MQHTGQTDISWAVYQLFCEGWNTVQITDILDKRGFGGGKPLTESHIHKALSKALDQFYEQGSKPAVKVSVISPTQYPTEGQES